MIVQNDLSGWLFGIANISCLAIGLFPTLLKLRRKPEMPIKTGGKVIISSKETFYHVCVKPRFSYLIAIVAIFFVSLMILKYDDGLLALITLVSCSFAMAVPLLDMKIKEVAVIDSGLEISNFAKSIIVPFPEIKKVKAGDTRATAGYLFVEFNTDLAFGKKIYFLPVDRGEIEKIFKTKGINFENSIWY